jgi:hypothetical protein
MVTAVATINAYFIKSSSRIVLLNAWGKYGAPWEVPDADAKYRGTFPHLGVRLRHDEAW